MFKPCSHIIEEFDHHCQGLINDGEVMAVSKLSSSFKSFFIEVILQTNEFQETTSLSPHVSERTKILMD